MGRDSDILVGLDLGTKKIAVAVAERAPENPDKAQIIGIGQAPSRGLRKGMIVNLDQAVSSVSDAIADAESMLSGIKISRAVVAFSGIDVKCHVLKGKISLGRSPRQIMAEDIERVIETALSELQLPPSSCCLHSIPIKYAIDGNSGIDNPLEMTGIRLEVELTALVIPTTVAQNVVNCVEKAGVSVVGLVLKPVAEALGTLSADERAMGASLVAIGGGTTSVSIFSEGHMVHAAEIPVGGDHITNDISCVMKIPFAIAEELKKDIDVDPKAETMETDGKLTVEHRGRKRELGKEEVGEIMASRLDELFADSIVPSLKAIQKAGLPTDVILTGGVMMTQGIVPFADSYLGTSVRVGVPVLQEEMQRGRNDCRYSAVSGIIVYLMERRKNPFAYVEAPMSIFKNIATGKSSKRMKGARRPSQSPLKSFARNARELFRELF